MNHAAWSSSSSAYFAEVGLVRLLFQRGLAAIYGVAFLSALNQFRALLGERGLLPVPEYLRRVSFWQAPSVFHLRYSDRFFAVVAWTGLGLSLVALTGLSESGPLWLSLGVWLTLYALYLSIVNVGQTFYGFGWESMLLEAGFFAAFLGPKQLAPSLVPVLALRWMLLRVELGAGLIKLRHDRCWRDLTCLYYHYETQPMPNPLSSYFHHLPKPIQRLSVAFSHFVQIVVPFGLFGPQPVAAIAGCFIIVHQLFLIVSGNYAWLNWLTVVLAVSAFSDRALGALAAFHPVLVRPRSHGFDLFLDALALGTALLSIEPTLNFFSKRQAMNASYNPLHLVGSYGAFGSVTRTRHEIVLEGTDDLELSDQTVWREYEFKGKPGDPTKRPRQWAPYHLRLDWLMWFLPLRVMVKRSGLLRVGYELWFERLLERLLTGDPAIRALLRRDPFAGEAPNHLRAGFFIYQLTSRRERKRTGMIWRRRRIGEYLPAILRTPTFEARSPDRASTPKAAPRKDGTGDHQTS
ncbi:MAG TPA: lipase maturation factor family protein [Polyangiaceae bacterium]|nr:lipase maturation factor family protein [Polyangiaceae bacterium]